MLFEFIKEPEILIDHDGEALLYEGFFDYQKTEPYYEILDEEVEWRQDRITLYGKTHNVPRLQAWYGEKDVHYSYSGIKLEPLPWTRTLIEIKHAVEALVGMEFNSVLINKYRDGSDYAAWHSDDEVELGKNPTIVSVSLGESRLFHLRHKTDKGLETIKTSLNDGSVLVMKGKLQHHWKHQLAKTSKGVGPRINLTFRKIVN